MIINSRILILDFGSQFTQLIARRVRELDINVIVHPFRISNDQISHLNPKAIILSGGSGSAAKEQSLIPKIVYTLDIPILAICYSQQAMCIDFGGTVSSSTSRSYGATKLKILKKSVLFDNFWQVGGTYQVWMSHGDHISKLPSDFDVIAKTDEAPYAVIQHRSKKIFGIQFHPEVFHTHDGIKILNTFLSKIASCRSNCKTYVSIKQRVKNIIDTVGDNKVVLGLSGGIDSTVTASLMHKAIGKKLYCILIDNGFLRLNEVEEVRRYLKSNFNLQIKTINASNNFLSSLKNITNPEEKRKTIGRVFLEEFKSVIKDIGNVQYLAQGTIYSDVIESSAIGNKNITIKSHHNVGGLPNNMGNLKLIEPLRLLFKDEVISIGIKLYIPPVILKRHPFPGPGIAIRIIGKVTEEKCNILRKADYIFINILKQYHLYDKIWQAYAALLPIKTVGIMGDNRTYDYICVLKAVKSVEGMTADAVDIPHNILTLIARRIINEVHGINRVLYDITSKPPATIELE